MANIYTRGGDKGETGLVGGQRLPKDDARIEAYGTVDELNAVVGLLRCSTAGDSRFARLDEILASTQHNLFNLGAILATLPEDQSDAMPRVGHAEISALEASIDEAMDKCPPLRHFVLPGGSELNARMHLARTICRRAERRVVHLHRAEGCGELEVQYLNRLSDAFFAWARLSAAVLGHDEVKWRA